MPSLSELPSKIKRKKLARALECLGFEINTRGGKGSHIKVIYKETQKSITIPEDISKQVFCYLLKEIENYSNGKVTWEDIKKEL